MRTESNRSKKVASEIRKILGEIFVLDQDLTKITITNVTVSPNLRFTKVSYICPKEFEPDAALLIDVKLKSIQKKLAEAINLKYATTLEFNYDKGLEYSEHIDKILSELK